MPGITQPRDCRSLYTLRAVRAWGLVRMQSGMRNGKKSGMREKERKIAKVVKISTRSAM